MRVTPVRRTVAVAVALVTGQALLCGVIGFVTFGDRGDAVTGARAAGPQFPVPPAGPPSASNPPSSSAPSARLTTRRPAGTTRAASRPPSPAGTRTPPAPPPAPPATAAVPPAPPATVTSPPGLAPLPTPSAEDDETQGPVRVRDRCDVEGAAGRTADGRAVRCVRGRDGDLRWRLE
ncbi:hypothetical protein [Actinoplanes sp. NPDC049118]|uniref:hypothetical protein n=1 Tax=Actinoplanes sp. NPDC049118 TaxID=3155769 RepID=UPI0033C4F2A2